MQTSHHHDNSLCNGDFEGLNIVIVDYMPTTGPINDKGIRLVVRRLARLLYPSVYLHISIEKRQSEVSYGHI